MAMNQTDQEQIEMIKQWWKDYGRTLAIAIVIGLALGFGWRFWREHKIKTAQQASVIYQAIVTADSQKETKAAQNYAAKLMTKYSSTPYASLAAFLWAREAVQVNDLALAYAKLQWVFSNSKAASFRQISRLRAARVLLAQGKANSALNTLAKVEDKAFMPLIAKVKGDAYAALGNEAQAKKSYREAKAGLVSAGVNDPFIDMKLAQPLRYETKSI